MKIAVFMSTYNGSQYLNEQLESLTNQTVSSHLTLYIRDDGSTDSTFEIIKQWRHRLNIELISGVNKGPAMSFWELLMNREITADFYAFCDQDDVWDNNKLEASINALHGDTHLALCNCRLIDSIGNVLQHKMYDEPPTVSVMRQFVCGIAQGCSMVFTDSLRTYFLNNPITCIPMHDSIVILHALGYGKVAWENEPKFSYRMHANNVVAKANKSLIRKIKTTYHNWKTSAKYSMSFVAAELLDKPLDLTDEEKLFLTHTAKYRHSLKSKLYILRNAYTEGVPHRAVNSYRMRVLLNLY